jgi:hypothetical protein
VAAPIHHPLCGLPHRTWTLAILALMFLVLLAGGSCGDGCHAAHRDGGPVAAAEEGIDADAGCASCHCPCHQQDAVVPAPVLPIASGTVLRQLAPGSSDLRESVDRDIDLPPLIA